MIGVYPMGHLRVSPPQCHLICHSTFLDGLTTLYFKPKILLSSATFDWVISYGPFAGQTPKMSPDLSEYLPWWTDYIVFQTINVTTKSHFDRGVHCRPYACLKPTMSPDLPQHHPWWTSLFIVINPNFSLQVPLLIGVYPVGHLRVSPPKFRQICQSTFLDGLTTLFFRASQKISICYTIMPFCNCPKCKQIWTAFWG